MNMKAIRNCLSAAILASLLGAITLPVSSAAQGLTAVPLPSYKPAPGPLVGAGIPVLVIAGGAYWVVKRLRRKRS